VNLDGVNRSGSRMREIWKESSWEYQDALLLLGQSEGSRVLLEEGYWSVEMEEVQEHEMEAS